MDKSAIEEFEIMCEEALLISDKLERRKQKYIQKCEAEERALKRSHGDPILAFIKVNLPTYLNKVGEAARLIDYPVELSDDYEGFFYGPISKYSGMITITDFIAVLLGEKEVVLNPVRLCGGHKLRSKINDEAGK